MKRKIISIFLAIVTVVCLSLGLTACDSGKQGSKGLEYTLSDDGTYYSVSIGDCTDMEIVIPSTYNNLPVTTVKAYAFFYCNTLTSVTIPDSVTSIESYAFTGCTSLTSVTIGSGVTSIKENAFANCTSLVDVYYNGTASQWSSITFDDDILVYGNSNLYFNGTLATDITIEGISTISASAFYYCRSITSVTIGDGVTSIGNHAFSECASLTSVTIGDSVTTIGYYAFYACSSLTDVIIGSNVTTINSETFYRCDSLKSVTFGNTNSWYVTGISDSTSGIDVDVTDAGANATYLTDNYWAYYWYRSQN